jgi:hypothetical protein
MDEALTYCFFWKKHKPKAKLHQFIGFLQENSPMFIDVQQNLVKEEWEDIANHLRYPLIVFFIVIQKDLCRRLILTYPQWTRQNYNSMKMAAFERHCLDRGILLEDLVKNGIDYTVFLKTLINTPTNQKMIRAVVDHRLNSRALLATLRHLEPNVQYDDDIYDSCVSRLSSNQKHKWDSIHNPTIPTFFPIKHKRAP